MVERRTLLIGSLPGASAEEAMTEALELFGPALRYLPDGETGDRDTWVTGTIRRLRDHPDLEVAREGEFTDYDDRPRLAVRRGHRLRGDSLDLGYLAAYRDSRPVFDQLRERYHRPDLVFQVGVPSDLDLTLFTFGPTGLLRHRRTVGAALSREIEQIHAQAGNDVLFQVEVPGELVTVEQTPAPLRGPIVSWMSNAVVGLARRAPVGARFGVHLCLGDLAHQALAKPGDTGALVALTNAIVRRWPADRPLEYVHAPLAAGAEPPTMDPQFYLGLTGLRLPEATRFVAGFLHEGRTVDELRRILDFVDSAIGQPVDIAASCGLGRRDADAARTVLRQTATLCGLG